MEAYPEWAADWPEEALATLLAVPDGWAKYDGKWEQVERINDLSYIIVQRAEDLTDGNGDEATLAPLDRATQPLSPGTVRRSCPHVQRHRRREPAS